MGEECERLYGAHCFVAHRTDLLALFRRALPTQRLRLDHRCVEVDQDERFANGDPLRQSGWLYGYDLESDLLHHV